MQVGEVIKVGGANGGGGTTTQTKTTTTPKPPVDNNKSDNGGTTTPVWTPPSLTNPFPPAEPPVYSYENMVFALLQVHEVEYGPINSGSYHTSILLLVYPNSTFTHKKLITNKDIHGGIEYMTIGAGGTTYLEAAYNRAKDKLSANKVQYIKMTLTMAQVNSLITHMNVFMGKKNILKYAWFPEDKNKNKKDDKKEYNSNSFARGILNSIGYDTSKLNIGYKVPGWATPIPNKYFY